MRTSIEFLLQIFSTICVEICAPSLISCVNRIAVAPPAFLKIPRPAVCRSIRYFMLPNSHPDPEIRLKQLFHAIKRIYVSIFFQKSKDYIKVTSYRLEEEKMGIIIQKLVGKSQRQVLSDFSGVAKSYNFYPNPPLKSTDGTVAVAPGWVKRLSTGDLHSDSAPSIRSILFRWRYKRSSEYSPRDFFALDMLEEYTDRNIDEEKLIKKFNLRDAELGRVHLKLWAHIFGR